MSIPNKAKGTIRTLKNYTKGFSDIQKKVREVTSNDPIGPNGAIMNEITRATFSHQMFLDVVEIIDKRLNDSGKNWRHVFKALSLMEYLLNNGSDEVVLHCKNNLYLIKTLREFQYIDEQGKDHGMNVRHKAKDITDLLMNEDKLKEARAHLRENSRGGYGTSYGLENGSYATGGNYGDNTGYGYGGNSPERHGNSSYGQPSGATASAEDRELAMAIEESKRLATQTQQQPRPSDPDEDLRKAIELSKREAELREQNAAKENELVLLDGYDPNEASTPKQFNHIKQYDFFGNLVHDPKPTSQKSGQVDLLDLDPLSFSQPQNYANNHSTYQTYGGNQTTQQTYGGNQMSQQTYGGNQTAQQNFGQGNPFSFNTSASVFPNPTPTTSSAKYTGLENTFNQFNTSPTPDPAPQPSNDNAGFNSQYRNAFDGGFNAKLMPHQTQNNANAALATIARNAVQIDPFASLAAARSNSPPNKPNSFQNTSATFSSGSNPFQGTWSNATTNVSPPAFRPASNGTPNSLDIFNQPSSQSGNPFAAFQTSPQPSNPSASSEQKNIFF